MSQVVCLELRLEPIFRLIEGTHHNTSVVNEYVDSLLIGLQIIGAFPDALQTCQIQLAVIKLTEWALELVSKGAEKFQVL